MAVLLIAYCFEGMDEKEIKCRTLVNGQVKFIWITFKCCRAVHAGNKTTSILCWKSCQKCNDFMKLKRQWQLMVPTGVLPFSINLWWLNLCKNQVKEERGLNICFSNYVKKKKKNSPDLPCAAIISTRKLAQLERRIKRL